MPYIFLLLIRVLHNKNMRDVEIKLQLDYFRFEADNSLEWKINSYSKLYFPLHKYTFIN